MGLDQTSGELGSEAAVFTPIFDPGVLGAISDLSKLMTRS